MTLLVRDEVDIIEKNICYHLSQGVKHIIATDNGSQDGTLKILQKYEKYGVLTLLRELNHTYEQSKWVSRMARIAVEEQKATHIFHCDADEFWVPKSRSLLHSLPKKNQIFRVPLRNYLPEPSSRNRSYYRFWVHNPFARQASRLGDPSYRYLIYEYEPKIMTTSQYTEVTQGNHSIKEIPADASIKQVNDITIHHFPVRSYRQFQQKVINGGSSYANNPDQSPDIGWQWKEWYKLWKVGLLPQTYKLLCLTPAERQILQFLGRITETTVPDSIQYAKKNWNQ